VIFTVWLVVRNTDATNLAYKISHAVHCVRKGSDVLLCRNFCKCYMFCNMHSWSSLNLEHLLLIVHCTYTEKHFLLLRNLTFFGISLAIVWTIICRSLQYWFLLYCVNIYRECTFVRFNVNSYWKTLLRKYSKFKMCFEIQYVPISGMVIRV